MEIEQPGALLLVGAGNMGGALLAGWLRNGLAPHRIVVQEPSPPPATSALIAKHEISLRDTVAAMAEPPAIIVVAVKPQIMDLVFPPIAPAIGKHTVVLSVAAGRTIASFERYAPAGTAIVRSIPNTPASVGRGMTVAVANAHVGAAQKALCDTLLDAIGEVAWIEDESEIDAVTAVSGSGPAYVFYLTECLAEAGVKAGLATDLAHQLARATVTGAGELMFQSALSPATLRENVTSPNGTTAAALRVLMGENRGENALARLLADAVAAAARRSRELSG